jgi:hypothetical protein
MRAFTKGGVSWSWSWSTLAFVHHEDVKKNGATPQMALQKASVEDLDKLTSM